MIVPEHMEWHPDMNDYVEAKANLFRHQKRGDIAIYFADNEYSAKIAACSPGQKIPYYRPPGGRVREDGMIVVEDAPIIDRSEIKLLGEHNLQNICAALTAVWQVDQNVEAIKKVLGSFSGLEHRLELVRELDGVKYYDDSFATTPETTLVALQALPQPKVLILGGHDKGADYEALADEVLKSEIRHIIAIGQVGTRIANRLTGRGFKSITSGLTDMKSIVAAARAQAQPGDAVLLSCGTSSFGLFRDYKDRGDQFKAAVRELS
jgi:UDP-N-acetylmuramoylalanine--D-glutamate ligase